MWFLFNWDGLRKVKSFIRYLISISVVAPIALAAVGVSVGIAGPLQNRKFIHKGIESLPEWATRERIRKTLEAIEQAFKKKQEAGIVWRQTEKELETARLRQAESQQGVSSLLSQAEQSLAEKLSASPVVVVLSQEQIENMIREAVAKAAEAESNKPNSRSSFNPLTGTLTFSKPFIIGSVKVGEINIYGVLGTVGGGKYVLECIVNQKVEECVSKVIAVIREHLEIKLQEEAAAGGW